MITEEKFRSLVDSVEADIPCDLNDLPALYNHYQIPSDGYYCTTAVLDLLSERIREALIVPADGSVKGQIMAELTALKKQILLSYFVDGTEYQPYWAILNFISSSLSAVEDFAPLTDNEKQWWRAIRVAKEKNLLNPSVYEDSPQKLIQMNTREFAVAEAVRHWRHKGYHLKPLMGKIVADDSEVACIAAEIDSEIATYGGRRVADFLFQKIKPHFCRQQGRYHLMRRTTTRPTVEQRQIPVGHLFNLCVKHLEARQIEIPGQKKLFDNIIDMAKMFAGLFDVQPYHFVEKIHVPPHEFIPFLEESALFDRIFSFPQWRPSDVPGVLRGLFGWVAECQRSRDLAWTVEEAAAFTESVLRLCRNKREPHFFAISALRRDLGDMGEHAFQAFLDIFCHDAATVNAAYLRPDRALEQCQDFMFKPLIRINSVELCLMSPSWCAPAFYEAIAMYLRNRWGKSVVNKKIGDQLELYIREILRSKGITYGHGNYSRLSEYRDGCRHIRVPPGQCDLALETADTILLFEIKKQPFTRPSRTGDKGQLLYDLARGFIHGHQQLAKQAIILKEKGSLVSKK